MEAVEWNLTRSVLDSFYRAYDRLGYGFLESVYVSALAHELGKAGHSVEREVPVSVGYDGVVMGSYRADLLLTAGSSSK
jgi:GxxExxY protein